VRQEGDKRKEESKSRIEMKETKEIIIYGRCTVVNSGWRCEHQEIVVVDERAALRR